MFSFLPCEYIEPETILISNPGVSLGRHVLRTEMAVVFCILDTFLLWCKDWRLEPQVSCGWKYMLDSSKGKYPLAPS